MKKIVNENLNEQYYYFKLPNGLSVYLMNKKDYYKTYAIFGTRYGSLDQEFIPIDGTDFYNTPLGVAHFLEHKMFECVDGSDASLLFAQLGNDSNAFTTYDSTAYLFSGTDKIYESVETLLDFVQTPYFTNESVEKEKDIIEQELLMYMDKPKTNALFGILDAMYKKNLIKNDIGGTVDSIKKINIDILNKCYHSFYHPGNMALCVVGNIDVKKMESIITENQAKKIFAPYKAIKRKYYPENEIVNKKESISYFDVTVPKITIGLKLPYLALSEIDCLKNSCILDIIMSIYFSNSSSLYKKLKEAQIIDNSYDYDYYYESTYAYVMISCDTNKVDEFIKCVKEELISIQTKDIQKEEFIRYKRVNQASEIKRFNSVEYIANILLDFHFVEIELFDAIEVMNNITIEDCQEFRKFFKEEAIAVHKLLPLKK